MRSSISSSEARRPRRAWAHLGFGVWVAAALAVAAALVAPPEARRMDILTHARPPDAGYYLAHDRGGHVDHHVLYHGIDRVAIDRLAAADVLFLGNSRLMFALDRGVLRTFFAAHERDYYVLGFGHEEQDAFPLEIMRRYDLRPDVVVVNADGFFAADRSAWAEEVADETRFDAWKQQFEAELSHRVRRVLHRLVPHYVDLRRGGREFVIYRSREDGTWFVASHFGEGTSFDWPPPDRHLPGARSLAAAEAFKAQLDARGARLVLCVIPAPDVSLHRARAMAAHLGVPLLVPQVAALRTIDGSHVSVESAERVAASLLQQLAPHLR